MDIANWLVKLYLSEHFLQTAFIAIVFAAAIGHCVDRLMERASFGVVVNTLIVLLAIAAAASMEDRRLVTLLPDNATRISIVATAIGCGLLLMTASLRQWLRDHI